MRGYKDMRRKALQKDLFSGKLKPDDVKKMGYTADQVKEIISGRRVLPGESGGDFSGALGRLTHDPTDGDHVVYFLPCPPRRGLDFKEVRS